MRKPPALVPKRWPRCCRPVSPVVTSPLQRCEQLAHALIGLRPDLACKKDLHLQEMDFGDWEGRRWNAIGPAALDAWVADFAGHRPGGGESVQAFMGGVAAVWDEAWDKAGDATRPPPIPPGSPMSG